MLVISDSLVLDCDRGLRSQGEICLARGKTKDYDLRLIGPNVSESYVFAGNGTATRVRERPRVGRVSLPYNASVTGMGILRRWRGWDCLGTAVSEVRLG
ncbi:MAG: hypothetical protein ACYSTF_00665 [Planctomycetota bacterium]